MMMQSLKNQTFIYILYTFSLLISPLESMGGSINISWTGNDEPDLKGYYLYYGNSSGNYGSPHPLAANLTDYEITGLNVGARYYIALSAYDFSDNESARCQEISGIAQSDTTSSSSSSTTSSVISTTTTAAPTTTVPPNDSITYEDGEDGITDRWSIYDDSPSGAQVGNVFDSDHQSRVIQFSGSGTDNGYRLRNSAGNLWNNSSHFIVQWNMKFSESFSIYIDLETTLGHCYLTYTASDSNSLGDGEYVGYGLGEDAQNGQWHTYVRDLQADLNRAQPGVTVLEVNGFLIRGSGKVDDIMLLNYFPSPTTTTSAASTTIPGTGTIIVTPTTSIPGNISIPPPTGTVTINDGQNLTSSPNVILSLSATTSNGESLSKLGEMSFSNDNQVWSDPEPFSEQKSWILTAGEGTKTVYVLFGDAAGNWMTVPVQDDIIYEETQNTCNQGVRLSATSISASSEFLPFFAKENAIDGDPTTSWSTIFRLFQKDEFFTMDLGEVKNITSLSMYSSRMFGTDLFPTNFQIQVSNDNLTWVDIDTIQGYSTPLAPGSPDNWQYNSLACRFLKVSISKCRTFLFFLRVAQIAEIEVYGCDRGDQVPLIRGEKIPIRENEYPKNNASSEKTSGEQQVPGIPGKPVIKFVN